MNLIPLFEMQEQLDTRIREEKGLQGQDLLDEKIRALLTELGELSNEERSFKFWSEDQKPRTEEKVSCSACDGTGDLNYEMVQEEAEGSGGHEYIDCEECGCTGFAGVRNPLLEEYVDCLHFILSIGLDHEFESIMDGLAIEPLKHQDITTQFTALMRTEWEIYEEEQGGYYHEGLELFLGLGEMLGFTWEQIEAAYYAKNKVNHERQANGY